MRFQEEHAQEEEDNTRELYVIWLNPTHGYERAMTENLQ